MSAMDLLELGRRIQSMRSDAMFFETATRAAMQSSTRTSREILSDIERIEHYCQIQNRCDTALGGLSAIVELVGLGALKAEDL